MGDVDWSSILGSLAAGGASSDTMRVAQRGLENADRPPQFGMPVPAATASQALIDALRPHARIVDMTQWNPSGLWVGMNGFWIAVAGAVRGVWSYEGRNLFHELLETGTLAPLAPSVVVCSGQNRFIGAFSVQMILLNDGLLAFIRDGVLVSTLRKVSDGPARAYLQ